MGSSPSTGKTTVGGQRRLTSWIEGFLAYTEHNPSPYFFRKWAAVACVAGALERKVWTRAAGRVQYPNMFILLCGPPGTGKSDALREVTGFWGRIPELHVAPNSVSRASLADSLSNSDRQVLRPVDGAFAKYNSLLACLTEFGTFLTQYEGEFMSTLNQLWDCEPYKESKRSMKTPIEIPNPFFHMIAGTTPGWLGSNLPDVAWSEGFSSRLIIAFSAEETKINLWADRVKDAKWEEDLAHDIRKVFDMWGQIKWDPEVQSALQAWIDLGCPPAPNHPKLSHYIPRRFVHLIKLMIVFSASRSSEGVIRLEDYQAALDLLLETESYIPEVFRALKYSSDTSIIEEVISIIWSAFAKTKKGLPEHIIRHIISERAPSYAVDKIFQVMVQSRMITESEIGTAPGGRSYWKPSPKPEY